MEASEHALIPPRAQTIKRMETELAAANWNLGYLASEELPRIALAWLSTGLDSPSLRILAGESQPIMSEVGPMFERALQELNIPTPSPAEATMQIARHIAHEIVTGFRTPYAGAKEIWRLSSSCGTVDTLLAFVGQASDYEDFNDYQHLKYYGEEHCKKVVKEIEAEIIEEAHKLIH